jgi:hypothetical protein
MLERLGLRLIRIGPGEAKLRESRSDMPYPTFGAAQSVGGAGWRRRVSPQISAVPEAVFSVFGRVSEAAKRGGRSQYEDGVAQKPAGRVQLLTGICPEAVSLGAIFPIR